LVVEVVGAVVGTPAVVGAVDVGLPALLVVAEPCELGWPLPPQAVTARAMNSTSPPLSVTRPVFAVGAPLSVTTWVSLATRC
jgi:hypothetical protein